MEEFAALFEALDDPRTGNAKGTVKLLPAGLRERARTDKRAG